MIYSNEIYHYGVKGMRWGVRRYQKKDGSLTDADKRRARSASLDKKFKDAEQNVRKQLTNNYNVFKNLNKQYILTLNIFY